LDLPPIDFIPVVTTDDGRSGGGSRGAHTPAVLPTPRPAPAPIYVPPPPALRAVSHPQPKPPVEPPEPVKEPVKKPIREDIPDVAKEPVEAAVKPAPAKPSLDSLEPTPRPTRRKPIIDPQLTTRETAVDIQKQNQRLAAEKKRREWELEQQAEEQQQQELDRQARIAARERRDKTLGLLSDARHLTDGIPSAGTAVPVLEGPGGDGVPYGNFLLGVQQRYERDWRPRIPRGVTDEGLAAMATVTIGRDGTVLEARLTHPSGNRDVDESVTASLENVRQVVPLPEKAKESQRTITIEFNVKPKRSIG
jgi:TonB family protein